MSKEKYGFVYIWRDRKHKRYYIGCHWGREDDGYICSSRWMRKTYRRRPQDFKRRILAKIYTSKPDMFNKEQDFLDKIKLKELGKKYYNLRKSSFNWLSLSEERKAEIRIKLKEKASPNKGKSMSEEQKEKIRQRALERYKDPEMKQKTSEALKKRPPPTQETRDKLSKTNKGRHYSLNTQFKKGVKFSLEVIEKKRQGILKSWAEKRKKAPEDFKEESRHSSLKELKEKYEVSRSVIERWKKESSIFPKKIAVKNINIPNDFSIFSHLSLKDLMIKYGVSRKVIVRWKKESQTWQIQ